MRSSSWRAALVGCRADQAERTGRQLGHAGADARSRPVRDGPGKLRAAKGSRAGRKEGKGGEKRAGPSLELG